MIDQEQLDIFLEACDFETEAPNRSLNEILEAGLKENIALVFNKAANGFLTKGLLFIRAQPNFVEAKRCFAASAQQGIVLADYSFADAPRKDWDFYFSLVGAILACAWHDADRLANEIYETEVPANGAYVTWRFAFARMLSSALKDDVSTFEKTRRYADQNEEKPKRGISWWQRHSCYVEAYEALLKRDASLLERKIIECNQKFDARAKDKDMRDAALEYGGGEENEYVPDHMALTIVMLARKRGIVIEIDSPALPLSFIKFSESRN